MERTSIRALQIRPARLVAAALTFLTAALLLLLAAGAAHAAVWVIPTTGRAFPDTNPTPAQTTHPAIRIDAAGNEYEGIQVAVRNGTTHDVTLTWRRDSAPLIVASTILDRVAYVNVTSPTTAVGSHAGRYPDPLIPQRFGDALSVPAGETTSFYLLTHVPDRTPGGDYGATLVVQNGADGTVEIPFALHVWPFGWHQLSTRTGFSFNQHALQASLESAPGFHWDNLTQRRRVLYAAFQMLQQHGISNLGPLDVPNPTSPAGSFDATKYGDSIAQYLDSADLVPGGLDMSATRIPWVRWWPWRSDSYGASSTPLLNYLTEVCKLYKDRGWQDQAYAYILDETTKHSEELAAQSYARTVHRASATSGYRIKFLLTDDPRPKSLGGVKQANGFLFDDVDIWGVRYFYFFGRIPALRQRKAAGKEVWWYSYVNPQISRFPNYIIDKPDGNVDQRVWGWLMQRWDVDGLMNWALNEWSSPTRSSVWRDPYKDPLSYVRGMKANGDSCLLYPGYDPAAGYGLDDPYAAPVSSLRFEALRDGLEDREYLRLAAALPGGQAVVNSALSSITSFTGRIINKNIFNFPHYSQDPGAYEGARYKVAQFIATHQR